MYLLKDNRTGYVTQHITWFLPLKPKVLLTYSVGEGTEVEADILIFDSETKDFNEASDTWHWAPRT